MPGDFEDRLRRCMQTVAADVTPDPRTWRKVETRIRRDRTFRLAALGLATAAVVAFAAVALPSLIGRGRIVFEPDVAEQPTQAPVPAPVPAPTGSPAPPAPEGVPEPPTEPPALPSPAGPPAPSDAGTACGSGGLVAVFATVDGDLEASCADGRTVPLGPTPVRYANPAFAPDGSVVAFEQRDAADASPTLVTVGLSDGGVTDLGPGASPAFGPNGELASVLDEPGDGRQPVIQIRDDVFSEPRLEFPVFVEGAEEFTARHLSFDPGGDRLYWEAAYEGRSAWEADLTVDQPAGTPLEAFGAEEGAGFVAPSSRDADTVDVIATCCPVTDGDLPATAAFGVVQPGPQGPEFAPIASLTDLGVPFDPAGDLFVAPAGTAWVTQAEGGPPAWVQGERSAWFVGDGQRLFLVDANGVAEPLRGDVASAAFNPASPVGAQPPVSPEQTPPEPTVEPPGAESSEPPVTVVQIYLPRADDPNPDCTTTFAVERQVEGPGVLTGAVEALLAGPTEQERAEGYGGWFSEETAGYLNSATIDADGIAHVDFRDFSALLNNASTSCGSAILLSQLDSTVLQFPAVTSVRYSFDGDETAFYSWLQLVTPE